MFGPLAPFISKQLALTPIRASRRVSAGSAPRAFAGLAISMAGLIALVLLVNAGVFGPGKTGQLLLPLLGALLALSVLPRKYLAVLGERDTWVVMLVYSITFGGFGYVLLRQSSSDDAVPNYFARTFRRRYGYPPGGAERGP